MSAHEFSFPVSLRLPLRLGVGAYGLFIVWASLSPAGTGGRVFWGCVAFGAVMEVAQGLIGAGRTASLWDGLANSLGAALGVYVIVFITRKLAR